MSDLISDIKCELNIAFDNKFVIDKMEENKKKKKEKIINELKSIVGSLTEEEAIELFNKSISLHQSSVQGNGSFLENEIIAMYLEQSKIEYKQQVTINNKGIIVGFNEKKKRCYHIIDFVVGDDIQKDKSITEFCVISCKTTCRERWTQDDWTFSFPPRKYILLTISNDYPKSERFREKKERKIITCYPKRKDDRKYKLNFEDLIKEL